MGWNSTIFGLRNVIVEGYFRNGKGEIAILFSARSQICKNWRRWVIEDVGDVGMLLFLTFEYWYVISLVWRVCFYENLKWVYQNKLIFLLGQEPNQLSNSISKISHQAPSVYSAKLFLNRQVAHSQNFHNTPAIHPQKWYQFHVVYCSRWSHRTSDWCLSKIT